MVGWFNDTPVARVLVQLTDWFQANALRYLLGFKMYEANHMPPIYNVI